MLRQAVQPSLRSAVRSTGRTLPAGLCAPRYLSSTAAPSAPKSASQAPPASTTDDSINRKFPNTPDPKKNRGPEFIKGDEGSHGHRTLASFSMTGKTCVVTGACSGLGNLMARALVESGANQLAILDLKQSTADSAAKEMTQWIESEGAVGKGEVDIRGFACDVADEQSVVKAFKGVKDAFGKVDTVINSAGIVENFPALEYPTDRLQKLYAINVFGSHFVSREAAKIMIETGTQGGSIILIASMSGSIVNIPQPQAPYNASKAAVKHLGACLAVEWAKHGIRVNTLSPGYMLTSLTQQMFDRNAEGRQLRATWEKMIPMQKMGMPEDLKGAAVYLASDASRYTTGSDIIIDGGYTST